MKSIAASDSGSVAAPAVNVRRLNPASRAEKSSGSTTWVMADLSPSSAIAAESLKLSDAIEVTREVRMDTSSRTATTVAGSMNSNSDDPRD